MSELPPELGLNEPQRQAVLCTEGPLLVFAGAGSGKTRVITYRIAHLVASLGVPPYRILAVTFTNKAAREMRERLDQLIGEEITRDLWVGTFHATCVRLLRRYYEAAGIGRDFVIYDDADQRAVIARVLKELGLDEKRYQPRAILSRIHHEKQEGRGPYEIEPGSYFDDQLVRIYEGYERHLRSCNALDFEDIILKMMHLAESETDAGAEVRGRFQYVLVDEFQDTNRIQYRLIRQLVAGHHNLCVVGDDDQSIYRWRGADIRNIRGFREDFPDATVIKLEQNYRSTGRIVAAALSVIAKSHGREPKELWTANPEGAKVQIAGVRDERAEAAFVVAKVRDLIEKGTSPREIAVFYRIHAQSRVLEEAMRTENIPYQIIGGMKFFDRAEVKDLLAYLRVIANPRSDVDMLRIINVPARGIGNTTVDRLAALAHTHGRSIFDTLPLAQQSPEFGTAAKKKLAAFASLLDGLAKEATELSPSLLAARILEETGYARALQAENTAEADARLENLAELIGSIEEYQEEAIAAGEEATLAGYLERVTLATDVDQLEDAPRIAMMTVHGAKGLEFEAVLMTGMEDGLFPYKGLDPAEADELEEERRLAYVAITRARKRLWMTHTATRTLFGQVRYNTPSRFLQDLPPEHIEHLSTPAAFQPASRFIDRPAPMAPLGRGWRHPQAAPSQPMRKPGERYVEIDEHVQDMPSISLRKGSRVRHARFGEGEVVRVEQGTELAVVAFFPGWGEKKILARFLET